MPAVEITLTTEQLAAAYSQFNQRDRRTFLEAVLLQPANQQLALEFLAEAQAIAFKKMCCLEYRGGVFCPPTTPPQGGTPNFFRLKPILLRRRFPPAKQRLPDKLLDASTARIIRAAGNRCKYCQAASS